MVYTTHKHELTGCFWGWFKVRFTTLVYLVYFGDVPWPGSTAGTLSSTLGIWKNRPKRRPRGMEIQKWKDFDVNFRCNIHTPVFPLSLYTYIYTYTIIYRYHHISHIRDVHPNSPICSGVFEGPCHASALFPPRWLIGCETKSSSLALGMWNQPIAIARYPQVNIRIAMERSTMLLMGKSTISMSHFQ